MNIFISAKIDLRKQTSQILMFQYPRQTQNDISQAQKLPAKGEQ